MIAVAPDAADTDGPLNFREFQGLLQQKAPEFFERMAQENTYRYTNVLAVEVSSSSADSDCQIRLKLDGVLHSRPALCPPSGSLRETRFTFDRIIRPGIFTAHIETTPTTVASEIKVSNFRSLDGAHWVLPTTGRRITSALSGYLRFLSQKPWSAAIYFICLVAVTTLFITGKSGSKMGVILLAVAVYSSHFAISRYFSGHDETAHTEMFLSSINETYDLPNGADQNQKRADFYQSARQLMFDEDFYRLHGVLVPPRGTCPHMILGGCGISGSPRNLYKIYARFLPHFDQISAKSLILTGRIINILLTLLLLGLVAIVCGTDKLLPTFALLLSGAYLSQVASVTNDYPMLMLGLFGCTMLSTLLTSDSRRRVLLGFITFAGFVYLSRPIDRSWISGLLTIIAAIGIVGLRCLNPRGRILEKKSPSLARSLLSSGLVWLLGAIVTAGSIWSVPYLWEAGIQGVFKPILRLSADGHMLLRAKPYGPGLTLDILWFHFQSFVGTYVWGHSYFSPFVYVLFAIAWAYLTCLGVIALWEKSRVPPFQAMLILGFAGGGYFAMLMLLNTYNEIFPGTSLDAAVKFRFMAPGAAIVLTLPFLGIQSLFSSPSRSRTFLMVASYWAIVFLSYYQVRFFYCEAL